jgi:predicted nucleotidyltransferase component of viral defense system
VELFHLALLRALSAKSADKSLIALKGGCNLRFYFGSVRYSEDIDFDVVVIEPTTLQNKIERLLASPLIGAPLRAHGLEVAESTAPKQTDTTQRWKVGLRARQGGLLLRTKIEFSRRDAIRNATFEAVGREVLQPYGLTQVLAAHYGLPAAIEQKVSALAGRKEPQARDVFDLNLLLARPEAQAVTLTRTASTRLGGAIENAMSISFDEYRSQVVAFLDPEQAAPYHDREAWEVMQDAVVSRLEALR